MKKRKKIQKLLIEQYLLRHKDYKYFEDLIFVGKNKGQYFFIACYRKNVIDVQSKLIEVNCLKESILISKYKNYIAMHNIIRNVYDANINDNLTKVVFDEFK